MIGITLVYLRAKYQGTNQILTISFFKKVQSVYGDFHLTWHNPQKKVKKILNVFNAILTPI